MEQRHQEYIDYYRSRMRKYENNPMYQNSYQSEKAIYEAISGIQKLEEFRDIMETQKLHIKNAIALTKDKMLAEQRVFLELKEVIRARTSEKVLAVIESVSSETELVNTVNKIGTEVMKEISLDLMTSTFYSDFTALENIIVWENAEVPNEWKNEVNKKWAEDAKFEFNKIWNTTVLPEARKWFANWDLNYELLWEDRHRRLIPIPDEILTIRIAEHKKIRGI